MTSLCRSLTLVLLALILASLPLLAGCALLPKKPTLTPFPVAAMAPTSTPAPPTVDVAAAITAAVGTAVAQFVADMTATAAVRPSATPLPPSATQLPLEASTVTEEPSPVATEAAPYALVADNPRYETWGRPLKGCTQFDDKQPVRKFSLEVTLTNRSDAEVIKWYPAFTTAGGRELEACYYPYDKDGPYPTVPPGESRTVTLAAFCENNESIAHMAMPVGEWMFDVCFGAGGELVACP